MIFVSVGTHEQPFNRLIEEVDLLKKDKVIKENVIIQTGYCTYKPAYCTWKKLFSYEEMVGYVSKARIAITHGGPSSFIMPLQIGKIPIVVPRQKKFGEHVNNHQLEFTKAVFEKQKSIIVIETISDLKKVICNYESIISELQIKAQNNNEIFNKKFAVLVDSLMDNNLA